MEWFFQIKGKADPSNVSPYTWVWPPLWSDKVEAENYDEAKRKIEEMYGKKFPLKVLKKDLESNEFLLSLTPVNPDDGYFKRMFDVKTCNGCGTTFRMIEKYQVGKDGGGMDYCDYECQRNNREIEYYTSKESNGIHDPVIYRIYNKILNKSYIGKTKQAFTFRWYQHIFQSKTDTKFYAEMSATKITDWIFEVLEIVSFPSDIDIKDRDRFILERETFYMKKFDSVRNGYNTAYSISDANNKSITPQLKFE